MCSPTLMISVASNGLKFMQSMQQQNAAKQQAQLQNWRAEKNRILKETAENFKIRQKRKEAMGKAFAMHEKGRKARSKVFTQAEGMAGGAVNKVINDYFRQEGRYKNKVLNNLQAEAFQSMRAKEAYRLGQEFQSKFIPDVQFVPTFASSALNYADDYYGWKADQEVKLQAKRQAKNYMGGYLD